MPGGPRKGWRPRHIYTSFDSHPLVHLLDLVHQARLHHSAEQHPSQGYDAILTLSCYVAFVVLSLRFVFPVLELLHEEKWMLVDRDRDDADIAGRKSWISDDWALWLGKTLWRRRAQQG